MENNVVISVVTYKRIGKWVKLMRNLRKVRSNCPSSLNLSFLFVEDTKSSKIIKFIKTLISFVFLRDFRYEWGRDNLGESRDEAISMMSGYTQWFGFIDDDDYYREDVLKVLEPYLTKEGSLTPSIINFCMSGNFYINPNNGVYKGYPEKKNRIRKWDDKNQFGCIPSMASFISYPAWINGAYKFGYNPPTEETSVLMALTYGAKYVAHVGIELMFRNRAKGSLVSDMSKYPFEFMLDNIIRHTNNLVTHCHGRSEWRYLYEIFKYNDSSYLKCHGMDPDDVDQIFEYTDRLV